MSLHSTPPNPMIRHGRKAEQLAERAIQDRAVAQFEQRVLAGVPSLQLLDEAAEMVRDALNADYSAVFTLTSDAESLVFQAGAGWPAGVVGSTVRSAGPKLSDNDAADPDSGDLDNVRRETRFASPAFLNHHGVVSGMSVVIRVRTGAFGMLGAYSRSPRVFARDDLALLQSVGQLIATSLERDQG